MAILGFKTTSETLPLLPPAADEKQRHEVINDIITRINGIYQTLETVTQDDKMLKIVDIGTGVIPDGVLAAGNDYAETSLTVYHNLGFKPTLMTFMEAERSGETTSVPVNKFEETVLVMSPSSGVVQVVTLGFLPVIFDDRVEFVMYCASDRSDGNPNTYNIGFSLTGLGDANIKYYIFRNTAN